MRALRVGRRADAATLRVAADRRRFLPGVNAGASLPEASDVPDVHLEEPGSAANPDTQFWHIVTEPNGGKTLLNKSGGRAAAIWTGNATVGQRIGQWVDDSATGS